MSPTRHKEFSKLFEEVKIRKVRIKNRIAMAPMGILGLTKPDGTFAQRAIDYYIERAKGNVGLIITCVAKVENEIEKVLHGEPLVTFGALASLHELAESVHFYGSTIFVQLTAGLGSVNSEIIVDPSIELVSASAIPAYWKPSITTRALTIKEIEKMVKSFAHAATILRMAEIDGIELHGHEGYLFDQFTTDIWNKRNDKYGGDLKHRVTFPIEVLKAIKASVGEDFPVIYRYGLKHYIKEPRVGALKGEEFKEGGRDAKEGIEMAKLLEKAGFDGLHVDAGCYDSWYWAHPPIYQAHGCMVDMAEQAKKAVDIPVIAIGRLGIPELAEEVIEKGKADMVALGRALLADPYWPKKVQEGKLEDIRPCIGCHDGCMGRIMMKMPLSCTVNPTTGKERLYKLDFTHSSKKVLVVGGGVSGMEAARVSTIRGYNVTLYEKSNNLGGHLIEAGIPNFKKDVVRLLDWYKTQLNKLNVEIKLGTEVTPELVKAKEPDAVIVATGSVPIIPKILGIEREKVTTAVDLLLKNKEAGKTVVVVGGGMIGCEVALWLTEQGKKTTIIEMLSEVATEVFHANRKMLLDLLANNKVKIITNTSICEVMDEGIKIINRNFISRIIECDTVVLALGLKPIDGLYDSLSMEFSEIYKIGDCKKPRKILHAIWDGHHIGYSI